LLTNTEAQIIFSSNHMDAKIMADQIPGGPKELPDKITVSLTRDRWSQGSRHEPHQYMANVQRTLHNKRGRPLAADIEVETWQKPRTWQQVLAKQAPVSYTRYRYQGQQYERIDQIDLVADAYVEDGLFVPGALVPLAMWLSNTSGQQLQHIVTGQLVSVSCWQFKVEVKTRRASPDWTQVILGFGPREALLMRRGGQTALLRTPDVVQVAVSDHDLANIEEQLHRRWARPRSEVEEDLIRRIDAFRGASADESPEPTPSVRTQTVRESMATEAAACTQCGAPRQPGAKFCSQCGLAAGEVRPSAAPTSNTQRREKPPSERPTTKRRQAPFAPQSDDFFEID
jgi:hypothetical protein